MPRQPYRIPLVKDTFLHEEVTRQALADFILSGANLSMGYWCSRFEDEFAKWQGAKHAVLFNSGSSANLAIVQALLNTGRLHKGDHVGFSAVTWATNVMPLFQLGLIPVALDCSLHTLNLDAELALAREQKTLDCQPTFENEDELGSLAPALASRLKAILVTDVLGLTCDLPVLQSRCAARGVLLLEDNCESLGTVLTDGKKAGSFGLMSSFSFYVSHQLSTIEGGMVCTDDSKLADAVRMVRAHGWARSLSATQQEELARKHNVLTFENKFTFYDLGYNLRPTEVTGLLGWLQLPHLEEAVAKRDANYNQIAAVAETNPELVPLSRRCIKTLSSFAFPVVCKPGLRPKYIERFTQAGIETRPLIAGNIQSQPFYRKYAKYFTSTPQADSLHTDAFYVASRPDLTDEELSLIENCLASDEVQW